MANSISNDSTLEEFRFEHSNAKSFGFIEQFTSRSGMVIGDKTIDNVKVWLKILIMFELYFMIEIEFQPGFEIRRECDFTRPIFKFMNLKSI